MDLDKITGTHTNNHTTFHTKGPLSDVFSSLPYPVSICSPLYVLRLALRHSSIPPPCSLLSPVKAWLSCCSMCTLEVIYANSSFCAENRSLDIKRHAIAS